MAQPAQNRLGLTLGSAQLIPPSTHPGWDPCPVLVVGTAFMKFLNFYLLRLLVKHCFRDGELNCFLCVFSVKKKKKKSVWGEEMQWKVLF